MKEFIVRVSTDPLSFSFYEMFAANISKLLSETNNVQLNILLHKHASAFCTAVAYDVCNYLKEDKTVDQSVQNKIWKIKLDYQFDIGTFLSRFAKYNEEEIKYFLEFVENSLRNVFLDTILKVTRLNVYDDRLFRLREYKLLDPVFTSTDRIFDLLFERKESALLGHQSAI